MIRGNAVDDAALVSRCLSREPGAWELLVERQASFVRAESRRQLLRYQGRAEPADVDDAAQEVFSLLLRDEARTLRQFRNECSLSTWLAHVVRSVCRQLSERRRPFQPESEGPLRLPRSDEAVPPEGLAEAIARLPARDQKLLRLFFTEGKKYRQIAQALGISINSVGPLLARAIAATRRQLIR